MDLTHEHLDRSLEPYKLRDRPLAEEVQRKMAAVPDREVMKKAIVLVGDAPLVDDAGQPTRAGRFVTETIVRPHRRPILTVRDNKVTSDFVGPDSEVWKERILGAEAVLNRVLPAVGRIEVANSADFSWLGTGWLVADDIVITNRHVAQEFARRRPNGFTFRPGIGGAPMAARIDFLEEFERSAALEYALTSVLWIAPTDGPDIAFLRVHRRSSDAPLAASIALATSLEGEFFVATVGYPARDDRVPDQELVKRLFGDVYDKKRLAPGEIMAVAADEIEHDCSTLGGNSGSAVVNLSTGEAVGLHFAGLFAQANFAVPAPLIASLLKKVQSGALPGVQEIQAPPASPAAAIAMPAGASGFPPPVSYSYSFQIPVEITVRIGGGAPAAMAVQGSTGTSGPGTGTVAAAGGIGDAVAATRNLLSNNPDVLEVTDGFRFKRGWITDEPVVVVNLRRKLDYSELRAAGKQLIPPMVGGFGVDVRSADLGAQLEAMGVRMFDLERVSKPGAYREPPGLGLPKVKERMQAIFHVSPDYGLPTLQAFLGRVRKHLTATMYEWDKDNTISQAIAQAMRPAGNKLLMVTQRPGTQEAIAHLEGELGGKLSHVWASVGAGGLFPEAYHIKVASRDGEEVWLSSGNWKKSNQPELSQDAIDRGLIGPLRESNREWHAVIGNSKLATLFQRYIEFDFDEAQRVPEVEAVLVPDIELFVPEAVFAPPVAVEGRGRYFKPLEVDRELDVQPLLTPDRNTRGGRIYMANALKLVQSATDRLYIQNQSFNLLEENQDEFESFFTAVCEKQRAGLDVRIIFRDGREFSPKNAVSQQKLLERLKKFGLDTDAIKLQRGCHTKGIIVDGEAVLLGSHNLTNSGSLFNRDASLLVRDDEVAQYFEQIFLFDWEVLAAQQADELVGGVRVAEPTEETPPGFRRVKLRELVGMD